MNGVVYVAFKEPINQHPQKCRLGVCEKIPTMSEGRGLFSYIVSNDADDIFREVYETFNDIKETNYDPDNDAWMLPLNVVDKWITSAASLLKADFEHFKTC